MENKFSKIRMTKQERNLLSYVSVKKTGAQNTFTFTYITLLDTLDFWDSQMNVGWSCKINNTNAYGCNSRCHLVYTYVNVGAPFTRYMYTQLICDIKSILYHLS